MLAIGGLLSTSIVDRSVELGLWYSVVTGLALILVAVILQPQGNRGGHSAQAQLDSGKPATEPHGTNQQRHPSMPSTGLGEYASRPRTRGPSRLT